MFIFGKQKSLKEVLREHQRTIKRSIREIDRERTRLQSQEKTTIMEMKKLAKDNQMGAVKIMAKDLVRSRTYIEKFFKMRAELQAVSVRLVTLKSTTSMGEAMKGVSRAMIGMNRRVNMPQMQRIMREFAQQSEVMDMKQEMMGDTMDDMMEGEGEEEETEELVSKVLDEIGINLEGQLASTPSLSEPLVVNQQQQKSTDADLLARLDQLKK